MFNEKGAPRYWKLLKNATNNLSSRLVNKGPGGKIITSDQEKAEIFNEHFSTIGVMLADTLSTVENATSTTTMKRVTPTVMDINLTYVSVLQGVINLKHNKASSEGKVLLTLPKKAGWALTTSLLSLDTSCTIEDSVPDQWKNANVSLLNKKDDETEKNNCTPISLHCLSGKVMKTCVSSTITTYLENKELDHKNQWA